LKRFPPSTRDKPFLFSRADWQYGYGFFFRNKNEFPGYPFFGRETERATQEKI